MKKVLFITAMLAFITSVSFGQMKHRRHHRHHRHHAMHHTMTSHPKEKGKM